MSFVTFDYSFYPNFTFSNLSQRYTQNVIGNFIFKDSELLQPQKDSGTDRLRVDHTVPNAVNIKHRLICNNVEIISEFSPQKRQY